MFSKAQFNGALRTIKSTDAKLREAVTGAVSFVVFHYVAHSKNTTPREQVLEATSGIKWLHSALTSELGNMPKPDKSFTEEAADAWAAFAVSRVWASQTAKREKARNAKKDKPANTPAAPSVEGDPINPTVPQGATVEGEFHVVEDLVIATDAETFDFEGPVLIGTDGTVLELSPDEYNACLAMVMKLRMTSLRVA